MKHIQDFVDGLMAALRRLFIIASWGTFFLFVWFVVIGLLQTHGVIPGWSVFSILFHGLPWWGEILTIIAIPFMAGATIGMTLYVIYAVIFGGKK